MGHDRAAGSPRSGAQTVERALAVLGELGRADSLGVSELAKRVGLTASTTHRLLRVLAAGGYVDQDLRSERYRLGPALVPLGRSAERQLGLGLVEPLLADLAERTGESVNLGRRSGDDVLVVLHVPSKEPLRFDQAAGTRVPLHTSAMGKCLLAWDRDPAAAVEQLAELEGATPRTITDRQRLVAELDAARRRGWALNDEERVTGVRTVAVPVLGSGPDGVAVAAIAVQGPTTRITVERVADLAAELAAVSAAAAKLLGPSVA